MIISWVYNELLCQVWCQSVIICRKNSGKGSLVLNVAKINKILCCHLVLIYQAQAFNYKLVYIVNTDQRRMCCFCTDTDITNYNLIQEYVKSIYMIQLVFRSWQEKQQKLGFKLKQCYSTFGIQLQLVAKNWEFCRVFVYDKIRN